MLNQQLAAQPRVVVTVTFYKRDTEGNPTFNDETGARFWSAGTNDGSVRVVARIDMAQNVIKKGHDISSLLGNKTVDLRLTREDYNLLKQETKSMDEGIGAQFIVDLTKEPNFGQLTITQSKRGRNGQKKSLVIVGNIGGDEILPAQATLTDTVKVDTLEDIKAHLAEMDADQQEQAQQARAQSQAARQGLETAEKSNALV